MNDATHAAGAPAPPCLSCHAITKRFQGQRVLDQVGFTLAHGQMLGLIGPGGAGKSLLLKILCGLVRPDAGQVRLEGQDLTRASETQWQQQRQSIGMVFQNYALFDFMNVADNIALPLRMLGVAEGEVQERVDDILAKVSLRGVQEKMPNELSGGMKKRVSFARAVVRRPPILLYDDPTAGLDPVTSAKIWELLRDMQRQGTTAITVSHDLGGIRHLCDQWLLLDRGRIVFSGDSEALFASHDPFVLDFWSREHSHAT